MIRFCNNGHTIDNKKLLKCPICGEKNRRETFHQTCVKRKNIIDESPWLLSEWSDKNEKTPFDYAPGSKEFVYWKCLLGKNHPDYFVRIYSKVLAETGCPICCTSHGEKLAFVILQNMNIGIKENRIVRIYELRDPRDPECRPRYVGITVKALDKRLVAHLTKNNLVTRTHKNNWIKSLLEKKVIPTIHLIEEVENWEESCEIEKYWIKEFREQGYNLTNSTDGGEGVLGLKLIFPKGKLSHAYNNYIDREYVLVCYTLGETALDIGKRLSISHTTVYRIIKEYNFPIRSKGSKTDRYIQYSINGDFIQIWKSKQDIYKYFNSSVGGKMGVNKGYYKGFQWKEFCENYPLKISNYIRIRRKL